MKKFWFVSLAFCLYSSHTLAQNYETNVYYDINGQPYYYAADGKAYYYQNMQYPEYVQYSQALQAPALPNFANVDWWKTATVENVEEELKNVKDINQVYTTGGTALSFAAGYSPYPEVIKALIKAGAKIDSNGNDIALISAASKNTNPEIVAALIEAGYDVNKDISSDTPLMFAAQDNPNPEVIKALVKAGAGLNSKCENGHTPLMHAVLYNPNPEITKILIKLGSKPEEVDNKDNTALTLAKAYDRPAEVVAVLENPYADEPLLDKNWWKTATLEKLDEEITKGADVNASRNMPLKNDNVCSDWSVLMVAASNTTNVDLIKHLIEAGANLYAKNCNDATVLKVAIDNRANQDIIQFLRDEIESYYKEADDSEKAEFHTTFTKCIEAKKAQYGSEEKDASADASADILSTKECRCIFNAASNYMGYEKYKETMTALEDGRYGMFTRLLKKSEPAVFGSCY